MKKIFYISNFKIPVDVTKRYIKYEVTIIKYWLYTMDIPDAESNAILYGMGITNPNQYLSKSQIKKILQFFFDDDDTESFLNYLKYEIEDTIRNYMDGTIDEREEGLKISRSFLKEIRRKGGDAAYAREYLLYGLFGSKKEDLQNRYGKSLKELSQTVPSEEYIDIIRAEKIAHKTIKKKKIKGKYDIANACLQAGCYVAELSALEDIEWYGRVKEGSRLSEILEKITK